MAKSFNNSAVAYAMDKLGRIVPHEEVGPNESPLHCKWREAQAAFERMEVAEQLAWRERTERYPDIVDVLGQPR